MIGRHLPDVEAYLAEKSALEDKARELAMECGFAACEVSVNAADDLEANAIYLTVRGHRPKQATTGRSAAATGSTA